MTQTPETLRSTFTLPVPGEVAVTVKVDGPMEPRPGAPVLIVAHGSSNDLDFPLLVRVATHLAETGVAWAVRFNFPYMERGANSPDARPVLEKAYMAVYNHVVDTMPTGTPVFVGGKSLGARTAAELVSRGPAGGGVSAAGMVMLGYPLHSPGHTERLFLEPLRKIDIPSLFFCGTRDPLCHPDLLRPVLAGLIHPGRLHLLDKADHSLLLPRSSGRPSEDAYPEIARQTETFIVETLA